MESPANDGRANNQTESDAINNFIEVSFMRTTFPKSTLNLTILK
ncbi:hypothetical protein ALT1644_1080001 [Alteromonas macleodii]